MLLGKASKIPSGLKFQGSKLPAVVFPLRLRFTTCQGASVLDLASERSFPSPDGLLFHPLSPPGDPALFTIRLVHRTVADLCRGRSPRSIACDIPSYDSPATLLRPKIFWAPLVWLHFDVPCSRSSAAKFWASCFSKRFHFEGRWRGGAPCTCKCRLSVTCYRRTFVSPGSTPPSFRF